MKNLLIATTALIATAGMAAAEVRLSGDGRMGIVYNGADLNFSSRIRVTFTLSGETDNGLAFGGSFGAHVAGDAAAGSEGSVFVSGAFGRLAMGNVKGAAEHVIGDLPEVGFTDLSSIGTVPPVPANGLNIGQNEITYLTGDRTNFSTIAANNPSALYTYSAGALTFALSLNDGQGVGGPNAVFGPVGTASGALAVANSNEYAVGVKYTAGDYSVGLGYEVVDFNVAGAGSARHLVLGGEAKFGTTTVKAFYGDGSGAIAGFEQYGIGVTSVFDALTVKGYVKTQDFGALDVTSYGLGAEYSLGGGASLAGGIADNDLPGSDAVADFGIKFAF